MPSTLTCRIAAVVWFDWQDKTDTETLVFQDHGEVGLLGSRVLIQDGSMDGQANLVWHTRPGGRRIAAGASETFDLTAMTFQMLGLTTTLPAFVEIAVIVIVNLTETQNAKLVLGGAASNEFFAPFGATGDTVNVHAGGVVQLVNTLDGWAVSGTAKNLKVANPSAVDVSYEMAIIGRNAVSTSSTSGG